MDFEICNVKRIPTLEVHEIFPVRNENEHEIIRKAENIMQMPMLSTKHKNAIHSYSHKDLALLVWLYQCLQLSFFLFAKKSIIPLLHAIIKIRYSYSRDN